MVEPGVASAIEEISSAFTKLLFGFGAQGAA